MTIDFNLKLLEVFPEYRKLYQLFDNIRFSVRNPALCFCRVCGDFELHQWKAFTDSLICIECGTIYT